MSDTKIDPTPVPSPTPTVTSREALVAKASGEMAAYREAYERAEREELEAMADLREAEGDVRHAEGVMLRRTAEWKLRQAAKSQACEAYTASAERHVRLAWEPIPAPSEPTN